MRGLEPWATKVPRRAATFAFASALLASPLTACPPPDACREPPSKLAPAPTSLRIWVNAFIPAETTNARTLVSGPCRGMVVIRGPIPGVSDCFLTDDRSWSTSLTASSRMQSVATIDLAGSQPKLEHVYRSTQSVELDCESEHVEKKARATPELWQVAEFEVAGSSEDFRARVRAAARDPLFKFTPDRLVPTIDYHGTFSVSMTRRTITFDGFVDAYPAFEAYAQCRNGPITALFRIAHERGETPFSLFGDADRRVNATVGIDCGDEDTAATITINGVKCFLNSTDPFDVHYVAVASGEATGPVGAILLPEFVVSGPVIVAYSELEADWTGPGSRIASRSRAPRDKVRTTWSLSAPLRTNEAPFQVEARVFVQGGASPTTRGTYRC